MARNERTSKKVASKASKLLKSSKSSKTVKSVAASALTQAPEPAEGEEGPEIGPAGSMKLVLIDWLDSYGCSAEWESLAMDEPRPMACRSVGWLAHDGDDCKVIVPHIAERVTQGCGEMTIPSGAIKRVVDLECPESGA